MKQYNVTGMSCAACSSRVEKAVSSLEGVTACSVSLLTNSMGVEGTATEDEIIKAVTNAGYGASPKGQEKKNTAYDEELIDTETPKMKKRLIASLLILLPLMYVSMGHMMWSWPLPAFLDGNHIAMGIYELVLAALVMVINQKFFVNGFKGLLHRAPNMDTLVAMGSMASFVYSLYALFAMTAAEPSMMMHYMDEFYFESAAMILTLITVGKMLEARSKGKTTDALKSLMKLAPKTALKVTNGKEIEVPIEEIAVGDLFAVKPGASVPVDGIVIEGTSAIDESALTGESIPVDKEAGSEVSAATMNKSGYLLCKASRIGEDTSLAQIVQMVSDAAATKAPIAKIADKVSGVFVPTVIGIATLTFLIWLVAGETFGFALARAISVLVISCPCALGLATPVAIMVGSGMGAKNGILFKTAVSLEEAGKMEIIALDKTGTITKGEPKVKEIIAVKGTEEELLQAAYSLEIKSEHPLGKAIVEYANENKTNHLEAKDFKVEAGSGLSAVLNGKAVRGGKLAYIKDFCPIPADYIAKAESLAETGKTPLFFAEDNKLLGIIAVADVIKEDSAKAIAEMKAMGLHVVMLTGDNEKTAKAIGQEAGVDEVIAGVLPNEKAAVIEELQKYGKTAMVGDGINDAPALTKADMGIAIGAGTDVALDAANIVLMKSNLSDVAAAVRLSRQTLKNIKENLFWAFFYNIIGIPLAAGFWIPIFGWTLNPMFGAAAMSLSSFCVVSNALRLNLFKVYSTKKDKAQKSSLENEPLLTKYIEIKKEKEKEPMKITVKGMMCPHCEAHCKEAIEKIDGVTLATASHTDCLVTIEATKEISEEDLRAAVTGAGYEYGGLA